MNILLLSYIMNACCVRLKYHKIHTYIYTYIYIYIYIYIIEWKMVEVTKYIYIMIFNNTLNFKAQLITYI